MERARLYVAMWSKKETDMTRLLLIVVIAATVQAVSAQKFDFGGNVRETSVYSTDRGFGFEPGSKVNCSSEGKFCSSSEPFFFSAKVPEGNYRVTVTYGGADAGELTIKAEVRRLMLENALFKRGEVRKATFVVNVRRAEFPGGIVKLKDREKTMEWRAWDDKLTLEFNGRNPTVSSIEIAPADSLPTIFLLGDSTVCDQSQEPYASWGQTLTRFFDNRIAVANHAESGESLRSSFGAKRLEKVLSLLRKGDFVIIQFAHNDEKEKGDGVGAMTTFKASLKQYVEAIKAKGGIPILVTPMHRRTFDKDGKITNSHGEYPDATRLAAKEEGVALIDLTNLSKDFYEALGKERSVLAFAPGDGTHHNNYGAYELARMIASDIKRQKLPIAKFIVKDLKSFDPKKPDSPESFKLPPSPVAQSVKPLGN